MAFPIGYLLDTLVFAGIFGILSLSLNIEFGHTGLPNFGKVAFFMIGAYTSALITLSGKPFIAGIIGAMIVSGICGVLISLPAIRLREDYLAITTLAFGEILRLILKNEEWIAGGVLGLKGIPEALSLKGVQATLYGHVIVVYISLVIFYLFLRFLEKSPYGRLLKAIREDELAAQSFGKNTIFYKAQSFAIGSAVAGAAGSLYAQYLSYIGPDLFMPIVTFTVWAMLIIGGIGNYRGAILGSFIYIGFERGARIMKDYLHLPIDPNNLMFIIFGLLLIIVLLFRPEGVLREEKVKLL